MRVMERCGYQDETGKNEQEMDGGGIDGGRAFQRPAACGAECQGGTPDDAGGMQGCCQHLLCDRLRSGLQRVFRSACRRRTPAAGNYGGCRQL